MDSNPKMKILIVDDEEDLTELIRIALKDVYNIEAAGDGREGRLIVEAAIVRAPLCIKCNPPAMARRRSQAARSVASQGPNAACRATAQTLTGAVRSSVQAMIRKSVKRFSETIMPK